MALAKTASAIDFGGESVILTTVRLFTVLYSKFIKHLITFI
jgi:hypothetical protein